MEVPPRVKDLSGLRFGRLRVAGFSHIGSGRRSFWNCECDCGSACITAGIAMTTGHTLSCGCLGVEVKKRGPKLRHGKSKSRVWFAWLAMIQRCTYSRNDRFMNYGGRGIAVCDRWKDFDAFYEDMGDPPDGYTLERDDVNGDYTRSNCKWIPAKDQYYNKTNTVRVCLHGREVPFAWLVERSGVKTPTAYARLFRYGWSPERAFPSLTPADCDEYLKRYTNLRPEDLHHGPSGLPPGDGPNSPPRP